ncbi:MAG: hypothetical protein ABH864_02355 [archaeon]
MRNFEISEELETKLMKLSKKDKALHQQVMKKIKELVNSGDIEHYKNLRYDLKDSKRCHVGHFVLVFQYDKQNNLIKFDDFEHHDKIYG